MARVLGLDAVVPGKERDLEPRQPCRLDVQQTVFQLLPETGGGPVLDGEAGPLGHPVVFAAVEPLQLVAKVQRVRAPVPALAQIVKPQAEGLAHGQQPFEVRRLEPEQAAVDRPLGAHQVGVAFAVLGLVVDRPSRRGLAARPPVDHAQLVHQDFLGRPRLLERRRIDHAQQCRNQKLVREHRKLPHEMDQARHRSRAPSWNQRV